MSSSGDTEVIQTVDLSGETMYEILPALTCTKFQGLIKASGLRTTEFYQLTPRLAVFAPSDSAFEKLSPDRRDKILNMSPSEKENYVKSLTGTEMFLSNFPVTKVETLGGLASSSTYMFITRRHFKETITYANGAKVLESDVRAMNGFIQVLDNVPTPSIPRKIYGYIRQPDPSLPPHSLKFYTEFLSAVTDDYYKDTIMPMISSGEYTMIVPTDAAIAKIPRIKLEELKSNKPKLSRVIKQHIIPSEAVYTSFVQDQQSYAASYGRVTFERSRDAVWVHAGGVRAKIVHDDLTFSNGVILFADTVLGFVYNSALEEVRLDPTLGDFVLWLSASPDDVKQALVKPSGVTLFTPTNEAFGHLKDVFGSMALFNQSFISSDVQLHLMAAGINLELFTFNADYQSRNEILNHDKQHKVKVYRQQNELWAEGGYVKTRVVAPDVAVTNGILQYINGIFGLPVRDIPNLIYCEDWLVESANLLAMTGLNSFLKDPKINTFPCENALIGRTFHYSDDFVHKFSCGANQAKNQSHNSLVNRCAEAKDCDFTMLVPNGTVVADFNRTQEGRNLFVDLDRLRYVLERHLVVNQRIYVDRLTTGEHTFQSATGDSIVFKKLTDQYTDVIFRNLRAHIIHEDLGATNGVVHIIDKLLYTDTDHTMILPGCKPSAGVNIIG